MTEFVVEYTDPATGERVTKSVDDFLRENNDPSSPFFKQKELLERFMKEKENLPPPKLEKIPFFTGYTPNDLARGGVSLKNNMNKECDFSEIAVAYTRINSEFQKIGRGFFADGPLVFLDKEITRLQYGKDYMTNEYKNSTVPLSDVRATSPRVLAYYNKLRDEEHLTPAQLRERFFNIYMIRMLSDVPEEIRDEVQYFRKQYTGDELNTAKQILLETRASKEPSPEIRKDTEVPKKSSSEMSLEEAEAVVLNLKSSNDQRKKALKILEKENLIEETGGLLKFSPEDDSSCAYYFKPDGKIHSLLLSPFGRLSRENDEFATQAGKVIKLPDQPVVTPTDLRRIIREQTNSGKSKPTIKPSPEKRKDTEVPKKSSSEMSLEEAEAVVLNLKSSNDQRKKAFNILKQAGKLNEEDGTFEKNGVQYRIEEDSGKFSYISFSLGEKHYYLKQDSDSKYTMYYPPRKELGKITLPDNDEVTFNDIKSQIEECIRNPKIAEKTPSLNLGQYAEHVSTNRQTVLQNKGGRQA